jgi:threonine/homoserine/homoserine lactone efflux protein
MIAGTFFFFFMTGSVLGLSGGMSPGPLTALVISQTLRFGVKEGVVVAFAPILTDGPIVLISGFMVSGFAHLDSVLGGLSLIGAVFLLYLAKETFQASPLAVAELDSGEALSLRKSILTNLLNPHPYVFWFLVGGPVVAQALEGESGGLFGFIFGFFVCLVGSKVALALITERFRGVLQSRGYLMVMKLLGVALAVFALGFVVEGLTRFGVLS